MNKLKIANKEFFKLIEAEINNKTFEIIVKGKSMLPFYKDNQTSVTLSKFAKLEKYDVILFKLRNKYYLHRIIKINPNSIIAQGDGLISFEELRVKNVIARVISHKTNKKKILANNKFYKFRVKLWRFLRPIRRLLIKIYR